MCHFWYLSVLGRPCPFSSKLRIIAEGRNADTRIGNSRMLALTAPIVGHLAPRGSIMKQLANHRRPPRRRTLLGLGAGLSGRSRAVFATKAARNVTSTAAFTMCALLELRAESASCIAGGLASFQRNRLTGDDADERLSPNVKPVVVSMVSPQRCRSPSGGHALPACPWQSDQRSS